MKIFVMFFSYISLFSIVHAADTTVFTTLAFPSENVSYIAVKKMSKGSEPESWLLEIKSEKMVSRKINLPSDLMNREVISLIPTNGNKLIVLTQYTMERGDHPQLHLFNPLKKSWKALGVVACISYAKIKLKSNKLIFSCEEVDAKGETTLVDKEIKLPSQLIQGDRELVLPIAKLEKGALQGQFEGLPQEWNKLKLIYKNKEHTFTP